MYITKQCKQYIQYIYINTNDENSTRYIRLGNL